MPDQGCWRFVGTNHREREKRPKLAPKPIQGHFPAPRGARLCPSGAQVAQVCDLSQRHVRL